MTVTAERIAILGGGLMGHGIAQVFACCRPSVCASPIRAVEARARILDAHRRKPRRSRSLTLRRSPGRGRRLAASAASPTRIGCIEAAPENLELKQQIFADVERAAPPDAILASNTSVIPIGQIMTQGRTQSIARSGTHWWNPPYLVPLVEVDPHGGDFGRSGRRDDRAAEDASARRRSHVKKDVPGFVGNRLQHALWREAIALVAEGVCDARTVDDVVKSSFGARLAVLGPFENADLVGTDLTRAIHGYVLPALDRVNDALALSRSADRGGAISASSPAKGFASGRPSSRRRLRERVTKHLKASFGAHGLGTGSEGDGRRASPTRSSSPAR